MSFVENPVFFWYGQNGKKTDWVWSEICCGCVGAGASVVLNVVGWSVWCVLAPATGAVLTCWSGGVWIVEYGSGACVMGSGAVCEWLGWDFVWGRVWGWFGLWSQ